MTDSSCGTFQNANLSVSSLQHAVSCFHEVSLHIVRRVGMVEVDAFRNRQAAAWSSRHGEGEVVRDTRRACNQDIKLVGRDNGEVNDKGAVGK